MAATLAILRKYTKRRDPVLHAALDELRILCKNRIERVPLNGWASYKPLHKLHSLLWNIQIRYVAKGDDAAALVIVATIIGTLLCLRHEPDVNQDATYESFMALRALSSLTRSDGQQMRLRRDGKAIWERYKPRPTGRLLVAHLERLVTQQCRTLLNDLGNEFEADVLRYMLTHSCYRAIRLPVQPTKKEIHHVC